MQAGAAKRLPAGAVVELLGQRPVLLVPCLSVIAFWAAFYTYGALSCREGGDMWKLVTVDRYQAWPDMSATWLAQPLAASREYLGVENRTCGGTKGGRRPYPEVDILVCTPTMDVKADDTWLVWKSSFMSLTGLNLLFLALGMPFYNAVRKCVEDLDEARAREPGCNTHALELAHETQCGRRWSFMLLFGFVWGVAAHGVAGLMIMYLFSLLIYFLARKVAAFQLGASQLAIWVVVLLTMELTFRCLGDAPHDVIDPVSGVKSVHFWSRLEAFLCGDKLSPANLKGLAPSEVCVASELFVLKGLCPWYLYRFMSLKLISYAFDYVWHVKETPSIFEGRLDSKCDLEQRTERNVLQPHHYSWKPFLGYMFYVPLYSVGPILSYNAFVSQIERPQKTHSLIAIMSGFTRLLFIILFMEIFSVVWWYPFEFHSKTCNGSQPCLFDDLSSWELFLASHVRLHFSWMSLLIVWRYGRLMALLDGVDVWENMTKCVSTITSFTELWQIWHASMNKFMARYLFIPLGGKKCPWAVIVVFTFIAYWHEGIGLFSIPQWYLWACFNALGVTLEKVLLPPGRQRLTLLQRLARRSFGVYVVRGVTVLFVMLANLPAQYFSGIWQFYQGLLLDGWRSVFLILAVIAAYSCTALVEDLLAQDPADVDARTLPLVDDRPRVAPPESGRLALPVVAPPSFGGSSSMGIVQEAELASFTRSRDAQEVAASRSDGNAPEPEAAEAEGAGAPCFQSQNVAELTS